MVGYGIWFLKSIVESYSFFPIFLQAISKDSVGIPNFLAISAGASSMLLFRAKACTLLRYAVLIGEVEFTNNIPDVINSAPIANMPICFFK